MCTTKGLDKKKHILICSAVASDIHTWRRSLCFSNAYDKILIIEYHEMWFLFRWGGCKCNVAVHQLLAWYLISDIDWLAPTTSNEKALQAFRWSTVDFIWQWTTLYLMDGTNVRESHEGCETELKLLYDRAHVTHTGIELLSDNAQHSFYRPICKVIGHPYSKPNSMGPQTTWKTSFSYHANCCL